MDWKYKHFTQQAVFPADARAVRQSLRAFAADYLPGWSVTETPDGLELSGSSAGHAAVANFQVEPAGSGTRVTITMRVERASPLGFMLVDIGGYYDGQLSKWLSAVPWWIEQAQRKGEPAKYDPSPMQAPKPVPGTNWVIGCMIISGLLIVGIYLVAAIVGLLTGNLFLAGRGSGSTTLHGAPARIVSAIILGLAAWFVYRIFRPRQAKPKRGSGWLPPP